MEVALPESPLHNHFFLPVYQPGKVFCPVAETCL